MPIDSRVIDVINKAGGLTPKADTSVINLSKKIIDEMVIIIYSNEEVKNFTKTKEEEKLKEEKCQQKDDVSLQNDACIEENKETSKPPKTPSKEELISINKATEKELENLPGIGKNLAKDIINYRNTNGLFKNIEDIKKIPGIGEQIFAKIKTHITL